MEPLDGCKRYQEITILKSTILYLGDDYKIEHELKQIERDNDKSSWLYNGELIGISKDLKTLDNLKYKNKKDIKVRDCQNSNKVNPRMVISESHLAKLRNKIKVRRSEIMKTHLCE